MEPMITVKQMQRTWSARQYERLFRDLVAYRAEATLDLDFEGAWAIPAAAMAIIRMDELNQAHCPLYAQLIRALIAAQQLNGGWGDPALTALCLRALLCCQGHGQAIERGAAYLGNLQKDEGLWPRFPLRRMPEDSYVSAFILLQLSGDEKFRTAVRLDDAVSWFERNEPFLDSATRDVWRRAARRCRPARAVYYEACPS
jgi:hypothetical protein